MAVEVKHVYRIRVEREGGCLPVYSPIKETAAKAWRDLYGNPMVHEMGAMDALLLIDEGDAPKALKIKGIGRLTLEEIVVEVSS